MEFEFPAGKAVLLRMDEDFYRLCPFLDHRIGTGREYMRIGLMAFSEAFGQQSMMPRRLILHTGYCCSTLLSRWLDARDCLMLREPLILHGLARLRLDTKPGTSAHSFWALLLQMALRSLARVYRDSQNTVLKLDCNHLWPDLSTGDGSTRTIFLYQSVEDFLASVLKEKSRGDWFHSRLSGLADLASELEGTERLAGWIRDTGTDASPAEASAATWLVNMAVLRQQAAADPGMRSLDCRDLLHDPVFVTRLVRDHLNLTISESELAQSIQTHGETHAKDTAARFSTTFRALELEQLKQTHSGEIRKGLALVGRFGAGNSLPPASLL